MKCRISICIAAMTLFAGLMLPVQVAAQAKFTTFDAPGAVVTTAKSINPAGEITGFYENFATCSGGCPPAA